MSLGKIKFEDGREVELVEVLDDVIVIEKAGKDGDVKKYRLKKTSEMYESVADQVDALVKSSKKKAPKPVEPEDDDEDDDDEEEVAAKPAKKTGSVKGSGKAKDDADDEDDEEEAPKETKKGKKASKPVEPEDDEEDADEAPKTKKAVKTEKASKAPKEKAEDAYNWDEMDSYQEVCSGFLNDVANPNEAAVYLFQAEGAELEAIALLLNAERIMLAGDNCNLSLLDIKRASVGVKKRAKETDYKKIYAILDKLTDGDNSALIPEIVAATAEENEKSIFALFDKDFTKKNFGFLPKAYKTLVDVSESIANKFL